jgi:hypothetical protein
MKTFYYALATTKDNKSVRIGFEDMGENQPKTRFEAEKITKEYCKKKGLLYQDTRPNQHLVKEGSTMTKFAKQRKQRGYHDKKAFQSAL